MKRPIPLALAAVAALLHFATAWRYGYFRDELYFIACAKHLAWGYVDQPPLVAIAAWLAAPTGFDLTALRVLPVLAAVGAVWLGATLAAELGGGRFAQFAAGAAILLAPANLLLGNTLTTTSFEPLSWLMLSYAFVRLVQSRDGRWWVALGAALAFGLYGKYAIGLYALALAIGLASTRERGLFRDRHLLFGAALCIAATAPNWLWQLRHGSPMLEVLSGDVLGRHAFQTGLELEYRSVLANAGAFLAEQLVYAGPILCWLWIAGLVALFRSRRLAPYRAVGVGTLVLVAIAILLSAKGYYIVGAYGVLFAFGAYAVERAWPSRIRVPLLAASLVVTLPIVPFGVPVFSIDRFVAYTAALGLTGRDGTPPRLIHPLYAEEFGWDELAHAVANVYDSLPEEQRKRTAIFADTYADAGALSFYGARYGLPEPIGGQNSYYLWGPRSYDGSSMIAVGASRQDTLTDAFESVRVAERYGNWYKWVVEGPTPIFVCTKPRAPLAKLWPQFRWFGA